ncbi:DsbA family protein [Escherichia coli]|nr:DsbA family protein [Escherichia coli]
MQTRSEANSIRVKYSRTTGSGNILLLLLSALFAFQQYGIDKGIRAVFEKAGVSGEEYDSMMNSILVKARAAEMRQLFRDYKVTGTPAVFVNGQHINNSDCHGETPEAYRREYVDTVENLLKAGG